MSVLLFGGTGGGRGRVHPFRVLSGQVLSGEGDRVHPVQTGPTREEVVGYPNQVTRPWLGVDCGRGWVPNRATSEGAP